MWAVFDLGRLGLSLDGVVFLVFQIVCQAKFVVALVWLFRSR